MPALLLRLAPHLGLAALLIIAALGLALKVQSGRIAAVQGRLISEAALHETDIANFRAAQAKANADHLAEIDRITTQYRSLKDEADSQAERLVGDYNARVLRLPATAADPGRADPIALPGAGAAKSADRSGRDTVLLARTDALICATNIARLQAGHDWAQGLAGGH